jgi:hypothetical protein
MVGGSPFRRGGKHDHEASPSSGKKGCPRGSLPTLASRWCTCTSLRESVPCQMFIFMKDGIWARAGCRPVPPVLRSGEECHREIRCCRTLLLRDLHNYRPINPGLSCGTGDSSWNMTIIIGHTSRARHKVGRRRTKRRKMTPRRRTSSLVAGLARRSWTCGRARAVVGGGGGWWSKRRPPTSPSTAQARRGYCWGSKQKTKKFLQMLSPWSILCSCKVTEQRWCSYFWRPSARERSRMNIVREVNRSRPQGHVVVQIDEDKCRKCNTSEELHTYDV